jgi:hypothetical protein
MIVYDSLSLSLSIDLSICQVSVRRLPGTGGEEDAAHEAAPPSLSDRAQRAAEARQLGSDLESLLGL